MSIWHTNSVCIMLCVYAYNIVWCPNHLAMYSRPKTNGKSEGSRAIIYTCIISCVCRNKCGRRKISASIRHSRWRPHRSLEGCFGGDDISPSYRPNVWSFHKNGVRLYTATRIILRNISMYIIYTCDISYNTHRISYKYTYV